VGIFDLLLIRRSIVALTIMAALGLSGIFLPLMFLSGASQAARETTVFTPDRQTSALPDILSRKDADLYAQIFHLQRDGKWREADRLIRQLKDNSLLGHVLFQRYMHPTDYRSRFAELRDWMKAYADHPGARRIYKLAKRRQPSGSRSPVRPRAIDLPELQSDAREAISEKPVARKESGKARKKFAGKTRAQRNAIRAAQRQIRRWVQRGNVARALKYLSQPARKRLFDPVSHAESLGVIARGYYRYHYDDKAGAAAKEAQKVAGTDAALAHWWGGLSSFRKGDWGTAAIHFEALSQSSRAGSWRQAAGGFWASRAYLRKGEPQRVNEMLERAARHPRTFYGLLSIRALGGTPPLDFDLPDLSSTDIDFLLRIPAVRRAIALIEAKQTHRADSELHQLADQLPSGFATTLLSFADHAGLSNLAFRIGRNLVREQGLVLDGALYPLPGWSPMEGYKIDRALIFAIVRQESHFRSTAKSRAGARGLMQLMPATAGFMAGKRFRGAARSNLYDPGLNLSLGQKYIRHVLDLEEVENNLLYTLAAYNAGPGSLKQWRARIDYSNDPLLFVESLPSRETRNYIEHVLSNFWIYRIRLAQSARSMDQIIAGEWPTYMSQDVPLKEVTPPRISGSKNHGN
jgi:soluble lytic murein transglycosylase-like protein